MKGYKTDIEKDTLDNNNFRKVLYTAENLQLVLMSLKGGEDIGEEVHENDQFFRFEAGNGKVMIDGNEYEVSDGDVIIVPGGTRHNVINNDRSMPLKMYTIYAPPHHKDGTVQATREEKFDHATTE